MHLSLFCSVPGCWHPAVGLTPDGESAICGRCENRGIIEGVLDAEA